MFLSKCKKLVLTIFMFALVLSGQSFVFAEEQYSENLVPVMTGPDSHPTVKISGSKFFHTYGPWYAFDGEVEGKVGQWFTHKIPRPSGGHYLKVDFGKDNEKQVEKINITSWGLKSTFPESALKDWGLYGSNDDVNWTIVASGKYPNITGYKVVPYTFTNDNSYRYYRFNAISSYGSGDFKATAGVNELELMEKVKSTPEPEPEPNPEPNPEPKPDPNPEPKPDPNPEPNPNPTGNALLVIYMDSGLIKEFEMTNEEIRNFTEWYEDRAKGNGKEAYIVNKKYNIGPFNSRKDFISYSHIESFEVQEYSR
ncbi:hypothetical protein ABD74_19515 [Brevibacillus laterosporus]|nr:hypothetical protein [Brevibacillus laterosporus]